MAYYGLIILIIFMMPAGFIEGMLHPTQTMENHMTCDEFAKTARFNPYSVLNDIWFIFYYWGRPPTTRYMFLAPTNKELVVVRARLANATVPVNWTARAVLMKNLETRLSSYIVQQGEGGEFLEYPFQMVLRKGEKMRPFRIILKQTCENRFLGLMRCETEEVYAMSRITQIPKKVYIKDAAAAIGYKGRGGQSYLYQGQDWMPIEEDDEEEYWLSPKERQRREHWLNDQVDQDQEEAEKRRKFAMQSPDPMRFLKDEMFPKRSFKMGRK